MLCTSITRFGLAVICILGPAAPATALEGFTAESSLTALSDYRWRGASMTDGRGALQLGFDLAHDSGFWAWAGAGNVSQDYGGTELGVALGWTGQALGLEWTFGAEQNFYPDAADYDYYQASASVARAIGAITVSAGLEYAPAQDNLQSEDRYLWVGGEFAASEMLSLRARLGQDDGAMAAEDGALDYEAGVTVTLAGLDLDLAYVDSDAASSSFVLGVTARR